MSQVPDTPYLNVAVVVKAHGNKGEVVVRSTTGRPFSLPLGTSVYFLPPTLRDINRARIARADSDGGDARVRFDGVDSLSKAETLVGRTLLVRRSDIPDVSDLPLLLIGRSVTCADHGDLGVIVDIITTGSNEVWEVEGGYGRVLIPVIDEVVEEVPAESDSPIRVKLLRGLIDGDVEDGGRLR